MADLLKTRPSPSFYHAEFGLSALKGINKGNPHNCGALELRSLEMGGVAGPNYAPSTRVTTSTLVVM